MREEKRIKNSFIALSIILLIISLFFTAFIFYKDLTAIHRDVFKDYETVYIHKSKSEIKNVVNYFIESIKFERENAFEDIKVSLRRKAKKIENVMMGFEREKDRKEFLRMVSYQDPSICVIFSKRKRLYCPLSKIENNKKILLELIKTVYIRPIFRTIYLKSKNGETNKYLAFIIYNSKEKAYILTLENMTKIEEKLKDKFKKEINKFRYGISRKRYMFVLRVEKKNGKIKLIRLVNPNRPKSFMNKEIPLDTKDIKGKEFVKEIVSIALNKGEGFVEYYFKIIGENKISPKITYIKYYKPWNWIIGSGFYPDLYKNDLYKRDKNLNKIFKKYILSLTSELAVFNLLLLLVFVGFVNIIMKRIARYRNQLEEKEKFQIHLIESIPNPLFILNKNGNFVRVNRAFEKFFCVDESSLLKGKVKDKTIEELKEHALNFFEKRENNNSKEIQVDVCKTEKSIIEIFYSVYTDINGEPEGVIGIIFDITIKKAEERKLKQISIKDELTGLFNRRHFNEILNREILRANRYKEPLSMIMYDIDHFKRVNDTHGHLVGDKVLKRLSEIVKSNVRSSDYVFRTGGEEFSILLPNTDLEKAYMVAEKLRKRVENENFDKVGKITISLGVAQYSENETADNFIKRTDSALYSSKENGRNRTSTG
ncbi:diguanylate cyclase [Hippea alviniae]|uniref:diguanylate cyclase n=1 Tax=Hippea alviniae TaxID=1279027 RepID=UPI0012DCD7E6|nr:diguanylate cyclase [Hippea alviniae]